jgi:c-di-AMP phosphodiesterase-like protein
MEKVAEFYSENGMDGFDEFQNKYERIEDTMINSLIECFGLETFEKFKEWCVDTYEDDIYEYIYDQENYPMWNSCFEFRDSFYNSEEDIEKCLSVGLGVIEGLDDFNNLLFMTSAGHSFYSAYWIPLYFKFFPHEAEKYAGINYSDL